MSDSPRGMKLSLVEKVGYGLGDTASNFVGSRSSQIGREA